MRWTVGAGPGAAHAPGPDVRSALDLVEGVDYTADEVAAGADA